MPAPSASTGISRLGDELHVGGVVVDAGVLEGGADRDHVGGLALDLEGLVEVVDLLGAGVEGRLEDVVLGDLTGRLVSCVFGTTTMPLRVNRRETEPGSAIVPPLRVTAVRTSIAARLLVVGEALDEDRDALRAVDLVGDRLGSRRHRTRRRSRA